MTSLFKPPSASNNRLANILGAATALSLLLPEVMAQAALSEEGSGKKTPFTSSLLFYLILAVVVLCVLTCLREICKEPRGGGAPLGHPLNLYDKIRNGSSNC